MEVCLRIMTSQMARLNTLNIHSLIGTSRQCSARNRKQLYNLYDSVIAPPTFYSGILAKYMLQTLHPSAKSLVLTK